jgi:hypothetical protein
VYHINTLFCLFKLIIIVVFSPQSFGSHRSLEIVMMVPIETPLTLIMIFIFIHCLLLVSVPSCAVLMIMHSYRCPRCWPFGWLSRCYSSIMFKMNSYPLPMFYKMAYSNQFLNILYHVFYSKCILIGTALLIPLTICYDCCVTWLIIVSTPAGLVFWLVLNVSIGRSYQ